MYRCSQTDASQHVSFWMLALQITYNPAISSTCGSNQNAATSEQSMTVQVHVGAPSEWPSS
jgi:hypothetical protein